MRVPLKPTPDLIFFRLRQRGIYPVREDADGVGFETMCYYLIINTIKDLYCAVLREIATTCNLAVTNCHELSRELRPTTTHQRQPTQTNR